MSPRSENFHLSGPNPRVSIDWNNVDYRRSVLSSLVKGANILERDRLEKRDEIQALAPPWWKSFHFELYHKFIDKTGSIFGAIYEYKYPYPVPNSPQYVIAFRGTIPKKRTALRDIKSNFKCFLNKLHRSPSFQEAMNYAHKMVDEGARVWLAGHSLGSAMALLAGKEMAKMGHLLETFLFNPPFFSFPLEGAIKDERVKFRIRCATSVFKTGLTALNVVVNGGQADDPFAVLSTWVPYLFVNPDDPICSEYIGYFEHRKKMEEKGVGIFEMVATKNSTRNLCLSVLGMDSGSEPLHLLPSADLTINRGQFPDIEGVFAAFKKFRRAHGLQQWWSSFPYESMRYNYSTK
ncbi:hypothetical protein ACJW30_12G037300 [Castanea mollissima]